MEKPDNLSSEEFAIYSYLVENGKTSAQELSNVFDLSRQSIYKKLNFLIKSKLVKKDRKTFIAVNPAILYKFIDKEEKKIENKRKIANKLLKVFLEPKIKVFKGDEGQVAMTKELSNNILPKAHIIYNSDLIPEYLKSRKSRDKFSNNWVVTFTNRKNKNKKNNIYLKYKNQNEYASITVLDDRIAIYSNPAKSSKYSLLIEDECLANLLKDVIEKIVDSQKK